eukprot:289906_1
MGNLISTNRQQNIENVAIESDYEKNLVYSEKENKYIDNSQTAKLTFGFCRKLLNAIEISDICCIIKSYYSSYIVLGIGLNNYGYLGLEKWQNLSHWTVLNYLSNHYIHNKSIISLGYHKIFFYSHNNNKWYGSGCNKHGSLGIGVIDTASYGSQGDIHSKYDGNHFPQFTELFLDNYNNEQFIIHSNQFGYHTFILNKATNKLYGFGWNQSCQLGVRSSLKYSSPIYLEQLSRISIKKIQCGWANTLVLTENGLVYSFGLNRDNCCGHGYEKNDVNEYCILNPTPIIFRNNKKTNNNDDKFKILDICCGSSHSLCLDNNHDLWVFGATNYLSLSTNITLGLPIKHSWFLSKNIKINKMYCSHYGSAVISNKGKCFLFGFRKNVPHFLFNKNKLLNKTVFIQDASMGTAHSIYLTKKNLLYGYGDNRHNQLSSDNRRYDDGNPLLLSKTELGSWKYRNCENFCNL